MHVYINMTYIPKAVCKGTHECLLSTMARSDDFKNVSTFRESQAIVLLWFLIIKLPPLSREREREREREIPSCTLGRHIHLSSLLLPLSLASYTLGAIHLHVQGVYQ